jgi:uncharacterized protein (TIGR00297 family)
VRLLQFLIGVWIAAPIAVLAAAFGALTPRGAVAAFVVGTLTYASGGIGFTLVLFAFFVPSVLLSRFGRARKRELVDADKHGPRDALQVLANGGVATVCAVVWAFTHDPHWAFAFAGAYAAATADTWATEIGTLSRRQPRSILTLRPVATGLSGGITLPGTLAEIAGALWIGLAGPAGIALAYMLAPLDFGFSWSTHGPAIASVPLLVLVAIPLGGLAGATLDSILGATAQELRYCEACGRSCETDPHDCGAGTRRIRGLPGITNDAVNLAATAAGAAVAAAILEAVRFG